MSEPPTEPLVQVERREAVVVLRLHRPGARNAMSTALLGELLDALGDAVRDPEVRVLVLAGAGGSFSAGADLREDLDHDGAVRRMDLFCQVYEAVATCPKATVAALEGHCVGGGAEVAAACDLRVGDPTVAVRFPGAALGIPVGSAKLVGLLGLGAVKDLLLTARTVGAEEALRLGFLQRLAPAGDALPTALELAEAIAVNSPEAITWQKRQLLRFDGLADRVAAENDALHAFTEAAGDWSALTAPNPKKVGGWAAGAVERPFRP